MNKQFVDPLDTVFNVVSKAMELARVGNLRGGWILLLAKYDLEEDPTTKSRYRNVLSKFEKRWNIQIQ